MIERAAKYMTYGGSCTAAGCGAIKGGTIGQVVTLADFGIAVGIAVGLFGGLIQYLSWRDRREAIRREAELVAFNLEASRRRELRETELHQAYLEGRIDRRAP
jgi:uncharacterized protein YqgC (DUF456 family)